MAAATRLAAVLAVASVVLSASAQAHGAATSALARAPAEDPHPSGGVLRPEQACFDVRRYELELTVDPDQRSIEGALTMRADMLAGAARLVLDLDDHLDVYGLWVADHEADWVHEGGAITFEVSPPFVAGQQLVVRVAYGGTPRVAPRPPWDGGFTWSETADGSPWIATSCQGEGADLWWPCKDHPSDEPDGMDITVTVPEALVVASNGVLRGDELNGDGSRTFRWEVTSPINNYGVALNIAPYETLTTEIACVDGSTYPFVFYVLPEHETQARAALADFTDHIRWFEQLLGPYPFRAQKYGLVETPHLGMEHQSIVAYGNRFRPADPPYDWLHHHEASHEWWANLVTAADWKDMWIHEGFGTYMQALYLEDRFGAQAGRDKMARSRAGLRNARPVAPRESQDSKQIYFAPDGSFDNDIYDKGAWVLHTLRGELGDATFRELLRRFCHPTPADEAAGAPPPCRLVDTDDFVALTSEHAGRDMTWFFDVYLRRAPLPVLETEERDGRLHLRWSTPGPFPLGVPVRIDGRDLRVEMPDGRGSVELPSGAAYEIDPDRWLLRAR